MYSHGSVETQKNSLLMKEVCAGQASPSTEPAVRQSYCGSLPGTPRKESHQPDFRRAHRNSLGCQQHPNTQSGFRKVTVDKTTERFSERGRAAGVELRLPGASAGATGGYKVSEWGGSKKDMPLLLRDSGPRVLSPKRRHIQETSLLQKARLGCGNQGTQRSQQSRHNQ